VSTDRSGFYGGKHYTEYVETANNLKRQGRLDEAAELPGHLVDATENEARNNAGCGVAPWYYEQLAIIHAKRGDVDAEVAILERYAAKPHALGARPPRWPRDWRRRVRSGARTRLHVPHGVVQYPGRRMSRRANAAYHRLRRSGRPRGGVMTRLLSTRPAGE
jgi:hypothetical protein